MILVWGVFSVKVEKLNLAQQVALILKSHSSILPNPQEIAFFFVGLNFSRTFLANLIHYLLQKGRKWLFKAAQIHNTEEVDEKD